MPVLENFRPIFSPDPTDCPWVSEDELNSKVNNINVKPVLVIRAKAIFTLYKIAFRADLSGIV